jgi:hypothetical protein
LQNRNVRIVLTPLRLLWRVTGKPIYNLLFRAHFQAIINRLNSVLGEIRDARAELCELRSELIALRSRQDELDRHMRTVIAAYWDTTALSRRLAVIEDKLLQTAESPDNGASQQDNHNSAHARSVTTNPR